MIKAILFDLDETLILDEAVSRAAFDAAAAMAAIYKNIDLGRLAGAASLTARRLWVTSPQASYCNRIGHSSWEGLWAKYEPETHPAIAAMRKWAPGYRTAIWREALAEQSVVDDGLAQGMADRFAIERRRYPLYPEIPPLLDALQPHYQLGIVTNGVADLQREKLAGCGVATRFQASVVSGEIDCGKPDPHIFRHICHKLGVAPSECVMVGDNPERDVAGAANAGCKSVWVQRGGRPRDERFPADFECTDLSAMLAWLPTL